jgi:uncharacterized protein
MTGSKDSTADKRDIGVVAETETGGVGMIRRWRRLDEPGLEVMRLEITAQGIEVRSILVHAGTPSFGLHYKWSLDPGWRTRMLELHLRAKEERTMIIERTGAASWRIDGQERSALDGCDEVDISATPFCNGLAVRRLEQRMGELTALYVDVPEFSASPSRQRYENLGGGRWHYLDLGAAAGFEAVIELDPDGLVRSYQGLFEAM